MQLAPNDAEIALRDEIQAFLDAHQPPAEAIPVDFDERVAFLRAWQRSLHEAGLVGLSWPAEYGGRGATLTEQIVANQEIARAARPDLISSVGLDVVGPSLLDHGTDEQKARPLDRILSARTSGARASPRPAPARIWRRCRPAPLTTATTSCSAATRSGPPTRSTPVVRRARPDRPRGRAAQGHLLPARRRWPAQGSRCGPSSRSPATPSSARSTSTRSPSRGRTSSGALHGGWRIAMHTLAARARPGTASGGRSSSGCSSTALVEEAHRRHARRPPGDSGTRDPRGAGPAPTSAWSCSSTRATAASGRCSPTAIQAWRARSTRSSLARVEQTLWRAALDVLGAHAALGSGAPDGVDPQGWQHAYFYGRAASVYGGSAQIQKNIIAERILGLPRSG